MSSNNVVKDDIRQKVFEVISEVLQQPSENFSSDMTLFGDLGIESVEIMEINFMLEQEFGLTIGETDLWNLPNYLAERGLFKNNQFVDDARSLVEKAFPGISNTVLDGLRNLNDLLGYLTLNDLVEYLFQQTNR